MLPLMTATPMHCLSEHVHQPLNHLPAALPRSRPCRRAVCAQSAGAVDPTNCGGQRCRNPRGPFPRVVRFPFPASVHLAVAPVYTCVYVCMCACSFVIFPSRSPQQDRQTHTHTLTRTHAHSHTHTHSRAFNAHSRAFNAHSRAFNAHPLC